MPDVSEPQLFRAFLAGWEARSQHPDAPEWAESDPRYVTLVAAVREIFQEWMDRPKPCGASNPMPAVTAVMIDEHHTWTAAETKARFDRLRRREP